LADQFVIAMDPYTQPNERKVGSNRPKIAHLRPDADTRTRKQRQAEKQSVAAERRAIKKSARRYLKRQLSSDLEED
jgi:hypothetical protein